METKVFDAYGMYYDLLYKDKNYRAESDYIDSLITQYNPNSKYILELGCGTGIHAAALAEKEYFVDAIDLSDNMLAIAQKRKDNLHLDLATKINFTQADIRDFDNNKKYDVVISLFHVMSYMNTNMDLINAFKTASTHLNPNGIFIFDCWNGSGVMLDKPSYRTKFFENETVKIKRQSTPHINEETHIVDVQFDIEIENKTTEELMTLNETHKMRYLFSEELPLLLQEANLKIIASFEWMKTTPITQQAWNACYVCKLIQ